MLWWFIQPDAIFNIGTQLFSRDRQFYLSGHDLDHPSFNRHHLVTRQRMALSRTFSVTTQRGDWAGSALIP